MGEESNSDFPTLPDGTINISGDGKVTKKILKEGVGTATPAGELQNHH